MGVFFWTNSVALVEDIPLEEKYDSRDELVRDMDAGFQQVGTDIVTCTLNFDAYMWQN